MENICTNTSVRCKGYQPFNHCVFMKKGTKGLQISISNLHSYSSLELSNYARRNIRGITGSAEETQEICCQIYKSAWCILSDSAKVKKIPQSDVLRILQQSRSNFLSSFRCQLWSAKYDAREKIRKKSEIPLTCTQATSKSDLSSSTHRGHNFF